MKDEFQYDEYIKDILLEAPGSLEKPLKTAQKALVKMTGKEGEELFGGSGVISNKYSNKKKYFPNIRASFLGWRNVSLDKASSRLITHLDALKGLPTTQPDWDPSANGYGDIISQYYTQDFVPSVEKDYLEARDNLAAAYERLQRSNLLTTVEKEYDSLLKILGSGYKQNQRLSPGDLKAIKSKATRARRNILASMGAPPPKDEHGKPTGDRFQELPRTEPTSPDDTTPGQVQHSTYTSLTLSQKAYVQSFLRDFDDAFNAWYSLAYSTTSPMIDSPKNAIEETVIRRDGTIYRDKWPEFINNIEDGVVGASQRGYSLGGDLNSILRGVVVSTKYLRRGATPFKDLRTINPELLKKVHNNIMYPLFLKRSDVMIYATPEQWESIEEGGRLYKGITGAGAQAHSASTNRPGVKL